MMSNINEAFSPIRSVVVLQKGKKGAVETVIRI